jgi:cytochrome c oxidase assembly protein subunit 15
MVGAEPRRPSLLLERGLFGLVAATAGLLVVGASVRVNGAGLACPDWPLCFGEVVPPIDVQVGFEFGHRVLAGCISLGFLAAGVALRREGVRGAPARLWAVGAAVLTVQIVLGALTVWKLLAEWTVASHLLTGNTFCATLLLLALSVRSARLRPSLPPVPVVARGVGAALALLVPAQLFLGGWVAGAHAGLVCGAVPGCYTWDGAWFPTFSGTVGLQVTHRLLALVLWAASLAFLAVARGRVRPAAVAFVLAVHAQIAIGLTNVWLRLPVEVTLLHTAGAAAVFLSMAWSQWELWSAPVRGAATVEAPAAQPA